MDDHTLKKVFIFILVVICAAILVPAFLTGLIEAIGAYSSEYHPYGSNRLCFAFSAFFQGFWEFIHYPALTIASFVSAYFIMRSLYYWEDTAKFLNMDNSIDSNLEGNLMDPNNIEPGKFIDQNIKGFIFAILFVVILFLSFYFFFRVIGMPLTDFFDSFHYRVCSR